MIGTHGMSLQRHTLKTPTPTFVRAGIKWDPLHRDDLEELYNIYSEEEAKALLMRTEQQIKIFKVIAKFLRSTALIADMAGPFEDRIEPRLKIVKDLNEYIAQAQLPSYDLDLCCFCYGKDGRFIGSIAPGLNEIEQNLKQPELAFMHSGDDVTGTADAFDEELLINLLAIAPDIHHVFLVVTSVNHGFNEIKGGFWSLVRTKDEFQLMAQELTTNLPHKIHVMARLSRIQEREWEIVEIAEYQPLGNVDEELVVPTISKILPAAYLTPEILSSINASSQDQRSE